MITEEKLLEYDLVIQHITKRTLVTIDLRCNSWVAINCGAVISTLNGIPLNPGTPGTNNGESYASGGNRGEIFKGKVDIRFNTTAGNTYVIFIQKVYTNLKK